MSQIPGLATTNNDHRPSDDPQPVQKASTSDLSRGASGSAPDPASSLRAAALLTLKSKRRKPATDLPPAVPPRPIDTSFQLDYGQDDTLETSPQAVFTAPKVAPEASTSSTKPSPSDNEDAHVREEGEISDTEESKTPAPPRKNPASPKNVPAKVAGPTSASPSIKKKQPAAQPLLDRISSPVALPLAPSVVPSPVQHRAPTIRTVDSNMEGLHVLDSEHVRPGLAMNQDQYNAAKDIILDLLGWGVPPEYLVDCGLSRQIVFYVFHELNLRLPANLDTTGLVLYTPEVVASAHIARRTQSPTQPPLRHDLADSPSSSRILRHPSLPSRPVDTPVSPTSSLPTPGMSHPSPVSPPTLDRNPSLHDMEQQRRRELLARKAVQASRKQRAGTASDGNAVAGPSSITPASSFSDAQHDIAMASLVPNETVDDFLNSIGPVGETHNGKGKSVDVHRPSPVAQRLKDRIFGPSDQMDVDDAIPGFVTHMRPPSDKPLSSSPPPVPEYSLQDLRTPTSADSLQSNAAEPPPLTASSVETGHSSQNGTGEKPSLLGNGAGSSEVPRRGTKRPVAADFVDLEPRPPSHNGYANGHNNPLTRRKTGSFASVSGMRRCVIDLSDSEDEGGEVDDQGHNSRHPVLQPSRMGSDTPQYRISTPPYQTVAPSTMSTMSPAALHEKELEIRHMRELIAKKREETRLKKLASMSGRSTPNGVLSDYPSSTIAQSGLATSSTLPDAPVSVKQEEVDPPSSWINPSLGHEASNRTYHDAAEGSPMQEDDKVTHRAPMMHSAAVMAIPDLAVNASASTSGAATPTIDVILSNDVEGQGARVAHEQVITAEARQEQGVNPNTEDKSRDTQDPVGVDHLASSSAQIRLPDNTMSPYESPLESYPLLRDRSRLPLPDTPPPFSASSTSSFTSVVSVPPTSASSHQSSHSSSSSSIPGFPPRIALPDLKPLKYQTILKSMDPDKRICRYEVPGGGVCRDQQCEDVHLSRDMNVEPSDDATAEYLHDCLPRFSISDIRHALALARTSSNLGSLDERVSTALATLR